MFGGPKPFVNMVQMVIGAAGSIRLGEKVIGEWWFVRDGVRDVCQGWSWTWNLQFEWVEKVHEPVDLVNPIIKLWVFRGLSISSAGCCGCQERPSGPCQVLVMSLLIRYTHIPFYFRFSFTFPTSPIHHYAPPLQHDCTQSRSRLHDNHTHFIRPISLI